MKKVFSSNADCIHTFAQRSQDEGRTPTHSVYFHAGRARLCSKQPHDDPVWAELRHQPMSTGITIICIDSIHV